jgi:hypothetical protein
MKYRIGSICLYILGAIFLLATLAPVHVAGADRAYSIGVFVGKTIMAVLTVLIIYAAYKFGKRTNRKTLG